MQYPVILPVIGVSLEKCGGEIVALICDNLKNTSLGNFQQMTGRDQQSFCGFLVHKELLVKVCVSNLIILYEKYTKPKVIHTLCNFISNRQKTACYTPSVKLLNAIKKKLFGESLVDVQPKVKSHCVCCGKYLGYASSKTYWLTVKEKLLLNYLNEGNFCHTCSRKAETTAKTKCQDPSYLEDIINIEDVLRHK